MTDRVSDTYLAGCVYDPSRNAEAECGEGCFDSPEDTGECIAIAIFRQEIKVFCKRYSHSFACRRWLLWGISYALVYAHV